MTVKLLRPFNGYNTNDVVTLDTATEAALVSQLAASYATNGVQPVSQNAPFSLLSGVETAQAASIASSYAPNTSFRSRVAAKNFGRLDTNAGALGATIHTTLILPFSWWGVRAHAIGACATAQINCLANAAASKNLTTNNYTPTESWQNFLFSGAAAYTTTAATSGGGTSAAVQTETVSDILLNSSVTRDDGGTGYIFMGRSFITSVGNTELPRANTIGSTTLPITATATKLFFKAASDSVTTPANFTTPTEWDNSHHIYYEFFTGDAPRVLLAVGDSITQGNDGFINIAGAPRLAVDALNAAGSRWAFINQGFSSQTSDVYYTNGLAMLVAHRPTVAAFAPWSPNDADRYTAAGIQRGLSLAARWVDKCQEYRVTPVLVTPAPVNGITVAEEAFRRTSAAAIRQMCASGAAILVDRDLVFTNYASASGGYQTGLNATTLHPNPTGYALESQAWVAAIQSL